MTLAGTTNFNGLYIHNDNLLLDPAYNIFTTAWTLQFYYAAPTNTASNRLIYTADDNFYITILPNTNELQLNYRDSFDDLITHNLNTFVTIDFQCYTFIRENDKFTVMVDGVTEYTSATALADMTIPTPPAYVCLFPTVPGSNCKANFVQMYNITLTESYILQYYQYVFPNNAAGLVLNLRGDQDFTSNNNTVERDLANSSIITVDVLSSN